MTVKDDWRRRRKGAGYSSDIYAGVFGIETKVSCGAVIGAAVTVGTGDTDSKKTLAKTSTNTDFFGISVYTSKTIGDAANVAFDVGQYGCLLGRRQGRAPHEVRRDERRAARGASLGTTSRWSTRPRSTT